MARDTKWLTQRGGGQTWYAIRAVPRPLRAAVGKPHLLKSLKTADLHIALSRRHAALAEFEKIIERAREPGRVADLTTAALAWREDFTALDRGDYAGWTDGRPEHASEEAFARFAALSVFEEVAEDVETEHGREAARNFIGIARGTATPLLLHVDSWLAEGGRKGPLNERTKAQYRADLGRLGTWLSGLGITTLEGVSKAVAGRYVTQELVSKGVHWATGNRVLSAHGSYWKWCIKRGHVDASPWVGQSLAKGSARRGADRAKRPFTADEITALLAGPAPAEMADAMRVAALSGMRLEELYRLTVADCEGGWFNVRQSKSAAGVRRVPVHSALAGIVERRCQGKGREAFLFHEAGPVREGRERSAAMSTRFGRYRQRVRVHDRAEGARHSRVDFHSFRRWFITAALNAGVDRARVAAVVGHETGTLTVDTYHGGFSDALLRGCVEAVRLPV